MNKCRLCQQIINNLTIIYNNRFKSLAQIILKLKGYKDTLDINEYLAICEKCKQGIENVAIFWENIPEAKEEKAKDILELAEKMEEPNKVVTFNEEQEGVSNLNLSALSLLKPEIPEQNCEIEETFHEPIKLRIKLPPKRKRRKKHSSIDNLGLSEEIINTKRLRRPPKRYEDFKTNLPCKLRDQTTFPKCFNMTNDNLLENFPEMASLRLTNGLDLGKLVEVESRGLASRMRIICQLCLKVFRFEKEFQKHLNSHEIIQLNDSLDVESYLFYCKLCDKSFREHYAVRRHYRIAHSEERPLKCEYCEASFKYKFNLDYHMAKHIPKKHFECVFCKKAFILRYELQIHLRTHTKEKPYKCQFCPIAFAHRTNLKTHQKAKHPMDSTTSLKNTTVNEQNINSNEGIKEKIYESTELPLNGDIEENSLIADIPDITFPINFKDLSTALNNINTADLSAESKDILENIAEPSSVSVTKNEYKSLEKSEKNEVGNEFISNAMERLNNQTNFGKFHLDNSILNILPSSELLGLKKWPKSYQSTTFSKQNDNTKQLNQTNNLNNLEVETTNQKLTENYTDNHCNDFNVEKQQPLDIENSSIIKYKPLETNSYGNSATNSTNVTYSNNSSNIIYSSPSNSNCQTPISNSSLKLRAGDLENKQITNFEVPSGSTLTKGDKFINISKLSSSSASHLNLKHLGDIKQVKIIDKDLKSTGDKASISSTNYTTMEVCNTPNSKAKNNSHSWKVIKVSSRPVKIINLNKLTKEKTPDLKTSNNQFNLSITESLITNSKHNTSSSSKITPQFKETYGQYSPSSLLTSSQQKSPLKCSNSSSQSLLKPELKTQQIPALSLTKISPDQTKLSNKPLITNIEILPPLKTLQTLTKSSTTSTPQNLIKPPASYKYQCPYCCKYFKQKSPLTKHLRTHTGEKPYKCNLCPKSYADASNYKKHKTLHKNAAEALNISRNTNAYLVQNSPAYSTVSDPDPDGIEIMQTIKKFESSCTDEDEDVDDDASLSSSTMESYMWQDALENVLMNDDVRENIKRNLAGLNNAIMPKSMQQLAGKTTTNLGSLNNNFSSEDPD